LSLGAAWPAQEGPLPGSELDSSTIEKPDGESVDYLASLFNKVGTELDLSQTLDKKARLW